MIDPLTSQRSLQVPVQARMVGMFDAVGNTSDDDVALPGLVTGPSLSKAVACICCPNILQSVGWCAQVNQNEKKAVLYWGKYVGTLTEPGMYCMNPWGRSLRVVSTKFNTMELKDIKVLLEWLWRCP